MKLIYDPEIEHVALVDKAANKKKFKIIKRLAESNEVDTDKEEILHTVAIKKTDEEKRLVYGEVYTPYTVDTDEHFMLPDEIEKIAHNFMIGYRNQATDMNYMHAIDSDKYQVVESFIAKHDDTDYVPGSWVLGTKVIDDETWSQVKKGEITGYSLQGRSQLLEVTFDENGEFKLPDGRIVKKEEIKKIKKDARLDRCVESVLSQGYDESQAFAICNASLSKDGNFNRDAAISKADEYDKLFNVDAVQIATDGVYKTIESGMASALQKLKSLITKEGIMSVFDEHIAEWELNSDLENSLFLLRGAIEKHLHNVDMSTEQKKKLVKGELKSFETYILNAVESYSQTQTEEA